MNKFFLTSILFLMSIQTYSTYTVVHSVYRARAHVSILKLGGRILMNIFESFQIKYSSLVNSKKVGGRPPPCPPPNVGLECSGRPKRVNIEITETEISVLFTEPKPIIPNRNSNLLVLSSKNGSTKHVSYQCMKFLTFLPTIFFSQLENV